jgi:neopullulanase
MRTAARLAAWAALALGAATPAAAQEGSALAALRARPAAGELVYFLLPDRFENGDPANDRGGLKGDRLQTGFDPSAKGFYHGGDLKGLIQRLDYIKGLGATAVWVGPVFKNKPVQGAPGQESAGYHGYWITDFTRVDPHFGTNTEFKALVDAAHARGLKVYMDIIANHTADVIQYRERDAAGGFSYRSRADYPYSRRGGAAGPAINPGFAGDEDSSEANFAKLTDPSYAYTPFVPAGESHVKVPDWLNDPQYYHNRGNTTDHGENLHFGDFAGLDDLFTEHPRVRAGMIEIYRKWIADFGIDGYRIDTARYVEAAFPISRSSGKLPRKCPKAATSPNTRGVRATRRCSTLPSSPLSAPRSRGGGAPMCWQRCLPETCFTKAGSRQRSPCPPSLVTMTWAASPCWCARTCPPSARMSSRHGCGLRMSCC